MAFTTEQIRDYLMANPGMTDAQIAADMDRFGVTASQVSAATGVPVSDVMSRYEAATATPAFPAGMFSTPGVVGAPAVAAPVPATTTASKNLTPEQLQQFTSYLTPETLNQIYGGLADPTLPGGIRANLGYEWDSMESQVAGGPGRATLTGYSGPIGADDMYNAYSPTGEFLGRYKADDDGWKALLPIAMALGGQFLFGGGFPSLGLGTGAAGAGLGPIDLAIAAGEGIIPVTAAQTATTGLTAAQLGALGSGIGLSGLGAAGAAGAAGATTGGGTAAGTGAGAGTGVGTGTAAGGTGLLTSALTNPATLTNLAKTALTLGSLNALGGGGPSGPGSVPTQGIPMNTPEYFNQVQSFLNQYLPGQMPNQAQYLQSWYGTGDTMPSGGGMSPDTSVLQQVGLMPNVPTTPPVSAPPQTPATTEKSVSQTILDYLNTSTTLTDAEIASFMDSAGVSAAQMSAATGVPVAEVRERYEAATGRPAFPAGMFS